MSTQTFRVDGMTCAHCVAAVTREVGRISGVDDVVVDLDEHAVRLTASSPVDEELLARAVAVAGYVLAGQVQ